MLLLSLTPLLAATACTRPVVDATPYPVRPLATPALASAGPVDAWYTGRNDFEPAVSAGVALPTVSVATSFSSTQLRSGFYGVRDSGGTATYRSTERVVVRP